MYSTCTCAISSVGRAVRLHRKGQEFKSLIAHIVMNLDILYEDEYCIFINKQAGISVHGDGKTEEVTLADLVVKAYPTLASVGEPFTVSHKGEEIEIVKPGMVHRLDKDTSGVMLLAKTQESYEFFKSQFQERKVQKIYHAFIYGWLKDDEVTVDSPIGRAKGQVRRWMAGIHTRNPKEAHTDISVLKRFGDRGYEGKGSTEEGTYTLIEARPKTGRTHQVRVHLRSLNHPIVADTLYATKREKALGFSRMALHARSLDIALPNGERHIETAPYPEDFEHALGLAEA